MNGKTAKFLDENQSFINALGIVLELASENTLEQKWIPDSDWENGLKQEAEEQESAVELVWKFYNTL